MKKLLLYGIILSLIGMQSYGQMSLKEKLKAKSTRAKEALKSGAGALKYGGKTTALGIKSGAKTAESALGSVYDSLKFANKQLKTAQDILYEVNESAANYKLIKEQAKRLKTGESIDERTKRKIDELNAKLAGKEERVKKELSEATTALGKATKEIDDVAGALEEGDEEDLAELLALIEAQEKAEAKGK